MIWNAVVRRENEAILNSFSFSSHISSADPPSALVVFFIRHSARITGAAFVANLRGEFATKLEDGRCMHSLRELIMVVRNPSSASNEA